MGAIEELARLQKRYSPLKSDNLEYIRELRNGSLNIPDFRNSFESEDAFLKFLDKMETRTITSVPTLYQNELYYGYLNQSFIDLQNIVSTKNITFQDNVIPAQPIPVFGSINIDTYNAHIRATNGEPLIIFNEGLLKLTRAVCSLVAAEIFYGVDDKTVSEEIIRHYIDLMLSYHFYGRTEYARIWEVEHLEETDPDFDFFAEDILNSTMMFYAGHEYAHFLLNHLKSCKMVEVDFMGLAESTAEYRWQQEYDADLLSTILSLNNDRPTSTPSHFGVMLALRLIFLSKIPNIRKATTHPPIVDRISAIRCFIKENLSDSNPIDVYLPDMIIEKMQVQYKAFIEELVDQKIIIGHVPIESLQDHIYNHFVIVDRGSIFSERA